MPRTQPSLPLTKPRRVRLLRATNRIIVLVLLRSGERRAAESLRFKEQLYWFYEDPGSLLLVLHGSSLGSSTANPNNCTGCTAASSPKLRFTEQFHQNPSARTSCGARTRTIILCYKLRRPGVARKSRTIILRAWTEVDKPEQIPRNPDESAEFGSPGSPKPEQFYANPEARSPEDRFFRVLPPRPLPPHQM